MIEDFEICGYAIKLAADDQILRCDRYAHIGKIHSTPTHEFRKVMGAENLFIVRKFSDGYRITMEATECPGRL